MFAALTDAALFCQDDLQFITPNRLTYFVQAGVDGPIKIGSTCNLITRLRGLQLMSPISLRLLGVIPEDIEDECHRLLAPWRIHGEWFAPSPQVLAFLRERAVARAEMPS